MKKMSLQFKKTIQMKSYQNVVDQIQTAICDGTIKVGEKLPSEMKLKEMFDTSRGTVREALRVLEQKGLVSVKTGVKGGATVQDVDTGPMSESIGLLIRHQKVSLLHLAEFRTLMESYIAQRAAKIATKEDIEKLETILKEAKAHIESDPGGWKAFHEMDAKFHITLAQIADNPLVEANLKSIHDNIQSYFQQYLPFNKVLLKDNFEDLCKIKDAVEQKDWVTAGLVARQHISKFNAFMEERVAQDETKSVING